MRCSLVLGLAASASAHFVLQYPEGIGYDDAKELTGPCGGFSPTDRSTVTQWSVNGDSIGGLTTHPSVTWEFSVALVDDLNFRPLVNPFHQTAGVGTFCFSRIPGFEAWIGQDVVLQVIQNAPDGRLYQCAAIKFVAGGPDSVPDGCANSPGVISDPFTPADPPAGDGGQTTNKPSTGGSGDGDSGQTTRRPPTTTGASDGGNGPITTDRASTSSGGGSIISSSSSTLGSVGGTSNNTSSSGGGISGSPPSSTTNSLAAPITTAGAATLPKGTWALAAGLGVFAVAL